MLGLTRVEHKEKDATPLELGMLKHERDGFPFQIKSISSCRICEDISFLRGLFIKPEQLKRVSGSAVGSSRHRD